jgi:hypothetical protein
MPKPNMDYTSVAVISGNLQQRELSKLHTLVMKKNW